MKCFLALSLVALAHAVPPVGTPVSPQYFEEMGTVLDAYCVPQPGYQVSYAGPDQVGGTNQTEPISPTDAGTCEFYSEDSNLQVLYLTCAPNYTSATFPNGVAGRVIDGGGAWNASGVQNVSLPTTTLNYDFTAGTTFVCTAVPQIVCAYTCTTSGNSTGTGCNSSSGNFNASTSNTVCNNGYFLTGTSDGTVMYTCPAAGATGVTFVCSNSVLEVTSFEQLSTITNSGLYAYSVPGACTCQVGSVNPCSAIDANSPSCSPCLTCPTTFLNTRQAVVINGARVAVCPVGLTTLAELHDCFRQAACAGVINSGTDTCVVCEATLLTTPCPTCPRGSKKLLLLLLLLLLLIPAILSSLCCCLLLCLLRRKKTERNVHFATFDAGAPAIAAVPVAAEFPHHHHTLQPIVPTHHHHTAPFGTGVLPFDGAQVY